MTYNIRYDNAEDGVNSWQYRKTALLKQIRDVHPQILGIQEGLQNQITYIDSCLSKYKYIGVGRDDGKTGGEYAAIFYDTTEYIVLQKTWFWLSETPEIPSLGWDAVCIRICTAALLQRKSCSKKIWIFNTHLDHVGKNAQYKSIHLIIEKIRQLNPNNLPLIVMGDFNMEPSSEGICTLQKVLKDSYLENKSDTSTTYGTFNGFGSEYPAKRRIDYIFYNNLLESISYRICREKTETGWISDHFPVVCVFKWIDRNQ